MSEELKNGNLDQAVRLSQNSNHYLAELIQRANRLKLYKEPTWTALVHYKPARFSGQISEVDGDDFFLSRQGKTEPKAELEATLAGFFSSKLIPPNKLTPQCRFVARYKWLSEKLDFDSKRLKVETCEQFQLYMKGLDPESITVIYPTAYPNGPSSMFGHTSLRVDKRGHNQKTRMLDYTFNFAAMIDNENSLSYAVKGLTGGFTGRYTILPYYMKLREYAQLENRDIWEYKLKLSESEIDFIVRHAYEIAPTYYDYYFFTENCSYHLLTLIETAMPEKGLSKEFNAWVIPIDTIKSMDNSGILQEATFQPSHRSVIEYRRAELNPMEDALVLDMTQDGLELHLDTLNSLPIERQAKVLDTLYGYLRYLKLKNAEALDTKITNQERKVLLRRSKLKIASAEINIPTPEIRPENGHNTARLELGYGDLNHRNFTRLGFRGAYHDLLDISEGYAQNYQLEFFNLRLRHYTDTKQLELEELRLIDIFSLAPRSSYFKDTSWRFSTGFKSITTEQWSYYMDGGAGYTKKTNFLKNSFLYAFIDGDLSFSPNYSNGHRLRIGPKLGILAEPTRRWKLHLYGQILTDTGSGNENTTILNLQQNIAFTKDNALRLEAKNSKSETLTEETQIILSLLHYF
ncbi:MAG: DUF4105 domain-containing protein [Gammaproteobacteria bacterium]|nr:DUF4105 domain-containing protein [Gammaproteobacteria bacterium]